MCVTTAAKLFSSSLLSQFGRKDLLHWERRENGKQMVPVIHVWGRMAMVVPGAAGGRLHAGSSMLFMEGRPLEDTDTGLFGTCYS